MKKVLLILSIGLWGGWLWAQDIPDCDYNPYQHLCEEYIQTGREMYEDFRSRVCNENMVNELIQQYYEKPNDVILYDIGRMNCDTVTNFLKHLILTDPNEDTRCDALLLLGWRRPYNDIPFLIGHAKKDISPKEKIAVASVLAVLQANSEAIEILDKYCMKSEKMNEKCVWAYYRMGNNPSTIRFFMHYFDNPEYQNFVAYKLTELGEYEKTKPILMEMLNSESVGNVNTALFGLAAIGTPEAMAIINEYTKNSNPKIAENASFILEYIKNKRREKCGK